MKDLNNLVGKIKRIHHRTKTNEKIIDALIIDYTYYEGKKEHNKHRIDYIATDGTIGHMYITKNTIFIDIVILNEHIEKHLNLIHDAIIRKKKALDMYNQEKENIDTLITNL